MHTLFKGDFMSYLQILRQFLDAKVVQRCGFEVSKYIDNFLTTLVTIAKRQDSSLAESAARTLALNFSLLLVPILISKNIAEGLDCQVLNLKDLLRFWVKERLEAEFVTVSEEQLQTVDKFRSWILTNHGEFLGKTKNLKGDLRHKL